MSFFIDFVQSFITAYRFPSLVHGCNYTINGGALDGEIRFS
jgi:hypothetical protein